MATKSRYQIVNRGSRGSPFWCIEDSDTGLVIYRSTRRSFADGRLKILRRLQRDRDARLSQGYHLPGL